MLTATTSLAQSVATVLFTAKQTSLNRGGTESKLARGASLQAGDVIITAAASSAKFKYKNGTLVSLGENSNYKILSYSPKQGDISVSAELKKGKIDFKTTGKKKESLKTPVVALAILGTAGKVFVQSPTQTFTKLTEGEVRAGNTMIRPGQSVLSTPSGTVPATFPAAGNIAPSETKPDGTEVSAPGAGPESGVADDDSDSGSGSNSANDSDSGSDSSGGGDAGGTGAGAVNLVGTTVSVSTDLTGSITTASTQSVAPTPPTEVTFDVAINGVACIP